jgi:outer membrane beta-barrel protein
MAARLALVALLLAAAPAAPRAASKSDAFAGKIPPVSGQLYRKAGRLELTPMGGLSLNDAFFSKAFGGAKLGWHFTEFLSVSLQGQAGAVSRAGSAVVCPANQGCHPASEVELWQVPGRIEWMAGVEVAWAPVYGKLNVLAEKVAHFDLALLAGADWISHREVLAAGDAVALAAAGGTPGSVGTVGGHVGLGVRVFLSEALAVRWEVRDYIYGVRVPNVQEEGRARLDVQNQLFTELGVSVFFPFHNRKGP